MFMPVKDMSGFKMLCRGESDIRKVCPDMSFLLITIAGKARLQGSPSGCVNVSSPLRHALHGVMASAEAVDFISLLVPYLDHAPTVTDPEAPAPRTQSCA
ncbi:hypothetical protein DSL72_006901 [Monilinia vaccinii-corymbosi]|uniref:Uncharacterized protein n=1 Tax=Monilinia vaccinii-corymbosi TaxID=61207 RepID=A0A8A3PLD4_9HELO|nr:hypothetical protein DSL72_006901 [Monilinia vaccinii-corymbosi]